MYDEHVGAGKIKGVEGIKDTIDALVKDKKATVGHVKKKLYEQKSKHAEAALTVLGSKYTQHHFNKFHPVEVAAYLKPKLEKEGFEVDDKVAFASSDLQHLLQLRELYLEKKAHPYVKKKEEKKDK